MKKTLSAFLVLFFCAALAMADAATSVDKKPGGGTDTGQEFTLCSDTGTGICDLDATNDVFLVVNRRVSGAILYIDRDATTPAATFSCQLYDGPNETLSTFATDAVAVSGATITNAQTRIEIEGVIRTVYMNCTSNSGDNDGVIVKLFIPRGN
jgi:hypothetical protein